MSDADSWIAEAVNNFGSIQNLAVDVNSYPEKYTEEQVAVVLAAEEAEIAKRRRDYEEFD